MTKSQILFKNYLDDLYELGVIQGEHNINWTDEYNQLEYSKEYYLKTKNIADKYNIDFDDSIENYRENGDEDESILWDRLAFHINEITKEHILNIIVDA